MRTSIQGVLDLLIMMGPRMFVPCSDPNRHAPAASLELLADRVVCRGYQTFEATRTQLRVLPEDETLERKRQILAPFFCPRYLARRAVLDLGANGGFFSMWALQNGAADVVALEMDEAYVALLHRVRGHLGLSQLEIVRGRVGDRRAPADVVLALALVHWIYSCTEEFGSLDAVVDRLADLATYMLVVEWVEPDDPAIRFFHHVEWNRDAIRGPYTREEFERSLGRHFDRVLKVGDVSETRAIFVAFRTLEEIDLSGPLPLLWEKESIISSRLLANDGGAEYWSRVYDGGDRIYKQTTSDLAEHEAHCLSLVDAEFFPHVLDVRSNPEYSLVTLERINGSRVMREAARLRLDRVAFFQFVMGCLDILRSLQAARLVHRDIRPANVLLRDGKPVLVDFGWAVHATDTYPTPPGLGGTERVPDGGFCDVYSMGKVIEHVKSSAHPELDPLVWLMAATDATRRITDPEVLDRLARALCERPAH